MRLFGIHKEKKAPAEADGQEYPLEKDRFAPYPANHVHASFQVLTQGGERGARFKRLKLAH